MNIINPVILNKLVTMNNPLIVYLSGSPSTNVIASSKVMGGSLLNDGMIVSAL